MLYHLLLGLAGATGLAALLSLTLAALLGLAALAVLAEAAELTLLGEVAGLLQALLTLGGGLLLLGHNTVVLVLHQITLQQTTSSLVRGPVEHLGAAALELIIHLTSDVVLSVVTSAMLLHLIQLHEKKRASSAFCLNHKYFVALFRTRLDHPPICQTHLNLGWQKSLSEAAYPLHYGVWLDAPAMKAEKAASW